MIGAEVVGLEEHKLVFMACVERTSGVFAQGEVKSFDTGGGRVGAAVPGDLEFGATESGLDVGGGRCEDGFIRDSHFSCKGGVSGIEERGGNCWKLNDFGLGKVLLC